MMKILIIEDDRELAKKIALAIASIPDVTVEIATKEMSSKYVFSMPSREEIEKLILRSDLVLSDHTLDLSKAHYTGNDLLDFARERGIPVIGISSSIAFASVNIMCKHNFSLDPERTADDFRRAIQAFIASRV